MFGVLTSLRQPKFLFPVPPRPLTDAFNNYLARFTFTIIILTGDCSFTRFGMIISNRIRSRTHILRFHIIKI